MPPTSVTVQQFNFNSHSLKDGKPVAQFVAKFRRLLEHSAFHDRLDNMVYQRFAGAAMPTVRNRPHFEESV